ncbi:MAG: phosphodiester glycosidase family protein [Rhizobium sp.]|nr:phosphodiester glycosidase family protein [Rhizobium sp.]
MLTIPRLLLIAAIGVLAGASSPAAADSALSCRTADFRDVPYVVCTIDPRTAGLQLFWKNNDGRPFRTFTDVAASVAAGGKTLTFAMNAGMYTDDYAPLGLYIEDGHELRPVNTQDIKGPAGSIPNFYKKPNGVFYLDEAGAGIVSADVFVKRPKKVRFATQSGPMLVIKGEFHPAFIVGSKDRTRRSGVGLCEDGLLRFAISDAPVNFHDFAALFRDELKCDDALFLDGGRGAGVFIPVLDREDWSWHGGYGPMFGLVE